VPLNSEALEPDGKLNILSRVEIAAGNTTLASAEDRVWRGRSPFSEGLFELGEETRDGVDGVNAMGVDVGMCNEGEVLVVPSLLFLLGGS